jgi:hypothetical protein
MIPDPTSLQPRSLDDLRRALQYYRRHRAAYPLPEGWSEDISGLESAFDDPDCEPDPILHFTADRWRGQLWVFADLYYAEVATVCVRDGSGDGVSPWELAGILFDLLGVELSPTDLEDATQDSSGEFDLRVPFPPQGQ